MGAVQNLLSFLLGFGIPALIGFRMPKRWRVGALILWMLGPAVALLALGGIEAASNPAQGDLAKLFEGLALIGSVLVVPWMLACLAGFALGSVLRSRRGAKVVESALPATAHWESPAAADAAITRHTAPDASLMVELEALEWRNGDWVHAPRVTELATGRRLLDLWGSDWHAVVAFPRGQAVRLSMHSYRRGTALALEIDLVTGRYTLQGSSDSGAIADLAAVFDGDARDPHYGPYASSRFLPPAGPRATPRAYGVALLILLGALLTIGAATYLTLRLAPDQRPLKLDRVPAMPRP